MKRIYLCIRRPNKTVFAELHNTILHKYKPRYALHYPQMLYIGLIVEDDSDITYLKLKLDVIEGMPKPILDYKRMAPSTSILSYLQYYLY